MDKDCGLTSVWKLDAIFQAARDVGRPARELLTSVSEEDEQKLYQ